MGVRTIGVNNSDCRQSSSAVHQRSTSLLQNDKTHLETYARPFIKLTSQSPLTPSNIATNARAERKPIMPEPAATEADSQKMLANDLQQCAQRNAFKKDFKMKCNLLALSLTRRVPNRLPEILARAIRTNRYDCRKKILAAWRNMKYDDTKTATRPNASS